MWVSVTVPAAHSHVDLRGSRKQRPTPVSCLQNGQSEPGQRILVGYSPYGELWQATFHGVSTVGHNGVN